MNHVPTDVQWALHPAELTCNGLSIPQPALVFQQHSVHGTGMATTTRKSPALHANGYLAAFTAFSGHSVQRTHCCLCPLAIIQHMWHPYHPAAILHRISKTQYSPKKTAFMPPGCHSVALLPVVSLLTHCLHWWTALSPHGNLGTGRLGLC